MSQINYTLQTLDCLRCVVNLLGLSLHSLDMNMIASADPTTYTYTYIEAFSSSASDADRLPDQMLGLVYTIIYLTATLIKGNFAFSLSSHKSHCHYSAGACESCLR